MSEAGILPTPDRDSGEQFADLVACHLVGELSTSQQEQLNAELAASSERRDEFVAMCVEAHLFAACVDPEFTVAEYLDDFSDDDDLLREQAEGGDSPSGLPLRFLPTALHGTVGWFSSDWPVAYLIATVICGVSMLIGSVVHVSSPVQVARQSVPLPSPLSLLPPVVGRITGMVDCKWAEGSGFRVQGSGVPISKSPNFQTSKFPVALGDTFALASGLMEITYDSGAKVILQGPVTYEVESKAGGFLSLGKLTARVETCEAASGNFQISQSPNLQIVCGPDSHRHRHRLGHRVRR